MSKVFLRILAFLLVPCLITDSVLAAALSQQQSFAGQSPTGISQRPFQQETIFTQTAVVEPLVILKNQPIDVEAAPLSQQTRRQAGSYYRSVPSSGFWRSVVAVTLLSFTLLAPAARLSPAQTTPKPSKPSAIERYFHKEMESREAWDAIAREEDQIITNGTRYTSNPNDIVKRDGDFIYFLSKDQQKIVDEDVKFFIHRWLKRFDNPDDQAKFAKRVGIPLTIEVTNKGDRDEMLGFIALSLVAFIFGIVTWWQKRRQKTLSPDDLAIAYFSAGESESHGFIPKMLGSVVTVLLAVVMAWSVKPVTTRTYRIDPLVDRAIGLDLAITSPGEGVSINPMYLRGLQGALGFRLLLDHELAHFLREFLPTGQQNDLTYAEGYAFARVLMLGGEDLLKQALINQGVATSKNAPEAAQAIAHMGAAFDVGKSTFHDVPNADERDAIFRAVAVARFGNEYSPVDTYTDLIVAVMNAGAAWEQTGQMLPGMNRPLTNAERGTLMLEYFDNRTPEHPKGAYAERVVRQRMVQIFDSKLNMFFYYVGRAIGLPEATARKMGAWSLFTAEIPLLIFGALSLAAKAPAWFGIAEPHSAIAGLVAVAALGTVITLQNAFETWVGRNIGETPSFLGKFKGFAPYLLVTWAAALHVSLPLIGILSLGAALYHLHHDQMLGNLSRFRDRIQGSA